MLTAILWPSVDAFSVMASPLITKAYCKGVVVPKRLAWLYNDVSITTPSQPSFGYFTPSCTSVKESQIRPLGLVHELLDPGRVSKSCDTPSV